MSPEGSNHDAVRKDPFMPPSKPKNPFHFEGAAALAIIPSTASATAHEAEVPIVTAGTTATASLDGIPPLPSPAASGRDLGLWMYLLLPFMFYFLMRNRRHRRTRVLRMNARH